MNEEKVINKIFELEDKIVLLKNDIDDKFRENTSANEKMIEILQRLDQERIFTAEWVKRIEAQVEDNKKEIHKLKQQLKIA
ncbi:MAG: hypothetical protein ABH830_05260 [Patescibacteria group bacterium]